jgi:hypothetical protein
MKKILLFISCAVLTAFCLTGCLDSNEDVTINANGSGVFKNTIDMSGLFDMLQMVAMMDTSANNQMKSFSDKNIDSSFSLGPITDTSASLTAEEKALFKDATVHLQVNQNDKVFKVTMTYPFKKVEDVQKIMELQQSGKGFNPMGKLKGNPALAELGDKGMPSTGEITSTTFKNGLIERRIDSAKLNDLKNDEGFNQMQNAEAMLKEISFSSTIHLPKAVKNTSGSKLTLSDDKKVVRIKYTLLDMIKTPKALEFRIEY